MEVTCYINAHLLPKMFVAVLNTLILKTKFMWTES